MGPLRDGRSLCLRDGPRALREHCGHETLLSLAEGAELMQDPAAGSAVDLPLRTYADTPNSSGAASA